MRLLDLFASLAPNMIVTIAGAGYRAGIPARDADAGWPMGVVRRPDGDLIVVDYQAHRLWRIDHDGILHTFAGDGVPGNTGDGGPAIEASTLMPDAICLDIYDNLYVGEKYGFRVRKVEARSGIVRTLVGNGIPGFGEEGRPGWETTCNSCESGIWADPDGTVFWGDCSGRLRRYDGTSGIVTTALGGTSVHDGEMATAGFLCGPGGLSVGPDRHIYIADVWSQRIRAIDPTTGSIRTVAGNGARAYGGDNGPATAAYLGNPHDVSVDSRGRVVIADTRHGHIRRVDEDGIIRAIAGTTLQWDKGDGGPAVGACLVHVEAVAHGPDDDIYLGDAIGRIRKIDARTSIITTIAGIGLPGYSGDGGPAARARIGHPTAIRFDQQGNLYFADKAHHVVRKVDREGIITTVVGCGEAGFSPDGTPAHIAKLDMPYGLAIAADGTVYISDSRNNRVRRVRHDGTLETVAGGDCAGDAGDGGPARAARLNEPHGLCFYRPDVLLLSDHFNNRVKAVKL